VRKDKENGGAGRKQTWSDSKCKRVRILKWWCTKRRNDEHGGAEIKKGGCAVKKRVAYGTKWPKPKCSKKQEASLISPSTPRPITVHLPPTHHFHLCLVAPGTSVTTPLTTLSTTKKTPVTTHLLLLSSPTRARQGLHSSPSWPRGLACRRPSSAGSATSRSSPVPPSPSRESRRRWRARTPRLVTTRPSLLRSCDRTRPGSRTPRGHTPPSTSFDSPAARPPAGVLFSWFSVSTCARLMMRNVRVRVLFGIGIGVSIQCERRLQVQMMTNMRDYGCLFVSSFCRCCDVEVVWMWFGERLTEGGFLIFDGDGKMVRNLKWCQTRMKICGIKLDLCVRACWVWYLFFLFLVFYAGDEMRE